MNDILPPTTLIWQYVEKILREVMLSYGFEEIRLPILEKTELFKRTIGEVTDIVEKEMYTFNDRNDDSLSLRPEGTAGCVRAGIEHGLLYHQIQRLWYIGPYFRHERPQKGRYRQFYQCGAEVFGIETPDIDAELIALTATIFKKLGLKDNITLHINSIGSTASRQAYRQCLIEYFTQHHTSLDEDSQRRLHTNPLRILDSKNPAMQSLIQDAPKLITYLDTDSQTHFELLQQYLNALNINFICDSRLVRGLDYYTKTVFEWVTQDLGAQGTVCGGGRYDGLVEQLGGKPTPGLGFAIGLERVVLLLEQANFLGWQKEPHVYMIYDSEDSFKKCLVVSQKLRDDMHHLRVILHCGGGALKNQFKKADKSGAYIALMLGEQESRDHVIGIKFLRENRPQVLVKEDELIGFLHSIFPEIR